jgi:hypothetical protein
MHGLPEGREKLLQPAVLDKRVGHNLAHGLTGICRCWRVGKEMVSLRFMIHVHRFAVMDTVCGHICTSCSRPVA